MTIDTITNLKEFLQSQVDLMAHLNGRNREGRNGYNSLADFVLKNGVTFDPATRRECLMGQIKMCYMNAAQLARDDRRLIYVEGYAMSVIPVMHAWCVTKEGHIFEPTWREMGKGYYGIPFKTGYVSACMRKYKTYGIIDQWEHDFPVLTEDPSVWRHPAFPAPATEETK